MLYFVYNDMNKKTSKAELDGLIERASEYRSSRKAKVVRTTFFPISRATDAEYELVRLAIEKHGGNVANFYVEMAKKYLKGEFK